MSSFWRKNRLSWNKTDRAKLAPLLGIIVAVALGAVVFRGQPIRPISPTQVVALAKSVEAKCSRQSYRPACYDQEIPKLMDSISMEDAFRVTQQVQQDDRSYQFCHVLGHELSAREVDKNPAGWKDVIARCPSGVCSNGCLHGGFQERFRADSLTDSQIEAIKPDLQTVCEDRGTWHPTGLEKGSCYHALGHLTMYMTNADLKKSAALCQEISHKADGRDYTQLCFDGVFMQIFQPLEPEDFALVHGKQPTKESLVKFCDDFSGHARGSCISESWPLFAEEVKTAAGTLSHCNLEETPEVDRCLNSLEYIAVVELGFDESKVKSYCSAFPSPEQIGQCFSNAASRFIETDYQNVPRAVSLCQSSGALDPTNRCFNDLVRYSTYNFHAGSAAGNSLCQALPEPWGDQCRKLATSSP